MTGQNWESIYKGSSGHRYRPACSSAVLILTGSGLQQGSSSRQPSQAGKYQMKPINHWDQLGRLAIFFQLNDYEFNGPLLVAPTRVSKVSVCQLMTTIQKNERSFFKHRDVHQCHWEAASVISHLGRNWGTARGLIYGVFSLSNSPSARLCRIRPPDSGHGSASIRSRAFISIIFVFFRQQAGKQCGYNTGQAIRQQLKTQEPRNNLILWDDWG
ncbi:hypothetical protein EMPG_17022 [Blastomyces silverae]|uniref:Uncharacterized protein n=1 Tax=Blastomyces silverae TaxID=2060906 RepID=A0A0H1BE71_9EURO|nr:hypothetical protein EMPG_17022 [Blastomyces silverae]